MWRTVINACLFLCVSSFACTLCPLRVPPRPRPLNQYKLPVMPEFKTEEMPKFCNFSRALPVGKECRRGFEKIFCSTDRAIESFSNSAGPEDPSLCSKSAHQWENSKWIVRWFDSLGKPAAGVSDGNYYWLGDYETCQELRGSNLFDGQYCRVELEVPDALVEEGCPQTDPLAINLGVCFPAACTAEELATVSQSISPYKLSVDCEFDVGWSYAAYFFVFVCVMWLGVQLYATTMESRSDKWYWTSLSMKQNANRALSTKRPVDGLHALHGLEFLTFIMIIIGNVYNYMQPYIENVTFSFDGVSSIPMHLTNNFSYQIDGLFALSALYTTYLVYGRLVTIKSTWEAIQTRLVRFWPSYIFCVLFMLFIFVGIASGPMWIHSDTVSRCEKSWWKNILFINNFFSVDQTCVDFGYVISLEAQYFVLLVLLVFVARSNVLVAQIAALLTLVFSILFTFYRVYMYELPPAPILTAEPIPMEKMVGLLEYVMTSFICRIPPYVIGFLFGIRMRAEKQGDIYTQISCWFMFSLSILSSIFVVFSLLPYVSNNAGHPLFLSLYAALHRPLWSFSLLSFLYLCESGWFEWINSILTWRVFSPLSKLTWIALVVVEPVILFFFTAVNRPAYATHWSTIYSAISATTMSYVIALLIDIFLTRPIRSLLLKSDRHHYNQTPGDELATK